MEECSLKNIKEIIANGIIKVNIYKKKVIYQSNHTLNDRPTRTELELN